MIASPNVTAIDDLEDINAILFEQDILVVGVDGEVDVSLDGRHDVQIPSPWKFAAIPYCWRHTVTPSCPIGIV